MMFNNSKFSGISKKCSQIATAAKAKSVVAAAVAASTLAFTCSSFASFSDITSISEAFTKGATTTTVTNVKGAGASYSAYQPSSTYSVTYDNKVDAVAAVNVGSARYNATGLANAVVERNAANAADNDTLWYLGTSSKNTVTLQGPQESGFAAAFDTNNLLVGSDNLFSNSGNAVGNNTNVDRLDIEFGKITASASNAFAVMDRGPSNDHDAFKIAAITAVDSKGNPTAYGALFTVADGTWGKTNLLVTQQEMILRKNDSSASNPFQPSDTTTQAVGGILIPTGQLVSPGTTIYGYSLFSGAVPSNETSAQLVNYTDLPSANSTSNGGGLDAVATAAVLYTLAVPEPTTAALAAVIIGGTLARRPKKFKA